MVVSGRRPSRGPSAEARRSTPAFAEPRILNLHRCYLGVDFATLPNGINDGTGSQHSTPASASSREEQAGQRPSTAKFHDCDKGPREREDHRLRRT